MTTTYANPKTDIPGTAGKYRPIEQLRPGWWIHLNASPSGKLAAGWEQVDFTAEAAGIVAVFFCGDQPTLGEVRGFEVRSLTEREAAKLGLVAEVPS